MRRLTANYDVPWTMEEIGPNRNLTLEVLAHFDFQPGEKQVMYDRDGGGYPGSPATCELLHFRTIEATGEGWGLKREQAPEVFQVLDDWLMRTIEPKDAEDEFWAWAERHLRHDRDYDDRED